MFKSSLATAIAATIAFCPAAGLAWDSTGHHLVAEIAYHHLSDHARSRVDQLAKLNAELEKPCGSNPSSCDVVDQAGWMDTLPGRGNYLYKTWHYTDEPLSLDGTAIPADISYPATNNAAWAIGNLQQILTNEHSLENEKALYLNFLVHIVADIHQPLHGTSAYSRNHPDGDRGGNSYKIHTTPYLAKNLHSLWDKGAGFFAKGYSHYPLLRSDVKQLAARIEADYPESSLSPLNLSHKKRGDSHWSSRAYEWAMQSRRIAKEVAYTTPENATVSTAYLANAQQTAEKQIAQAGYDLAEILNDTFN
jgi:hypothetical protein